MPCAANSISSRNALVPA
jgi:hypothetical protein